MKIRKRIKRTVIFIKKEKPTIDYNFDNATVHMQEASSTNDGNFPKHESLLDNAVCNIKLEDSSTDKLNEDNENVQIPEMIALALKKEIEVEIKQEVRTKTETLLHGTLI